MFNQIELLSFIFAIILAVLEISETGNNWYKQDENRGKLIQRQCRPVQSMFAELGAKHAQYYRMELSYVITWWKF